MNAAVLRSKRAMSTQQAARRIATLFGSDVNVMSFVTPSRASGTFCRSCDSITGMSSRRKFNAASLVCEGLSVG